MKLRIGNKLIAVADFKEASEIFSRERQASGEGASKFPDGVIYGDPKGAPLARVSYNGKVWKPTGWTEGDVPLFDPFAKD